MRNPAPDRAYRSGKQCRERWTCHHDPSLKRGHWADQEDLLIIQWYQKLGKKWFEISKKMTQRTENAIKNRFNLLLNRNSYENEDEEAVLERVVRTLTGREGTPKGHSHNEVASE
jgi:hypothetical protein